MTDVGPEQRRHKGGVTDPTGAVSSGLQPKPLRDEAEVGKARKALPSDEGAAEEGVGGP